MHTYEIAIKVAILTFPIIAFLITIPYMIKQYRKYGSIPFLRTVIIYSFVLYLMTAFFMVILPLPTFEEVSSLETPYVQLVPFTFVNDIKNYVYFSISDPSTYIGTLKNPIIYTNLFNMLLTLPFGFYLHYYFKKSWCKTIIYSFLLSLFFELTQLTGLYFIYPRPYRLFDVDDLIINTLGGFLGYILTPVLSLPLPSRDRLDELSYEKGKKVSFSRRALAYLIDIVIFSILMMLITIFFGIDRLDELYSIIYLLYFLISIVIMKGQTLGKKVLRIKIADKSGDDAKIYQLLMRYALRYIIFLKVFDIIRWVNTVDGSGSLTNCIATVILGLSTFLYIKTLFDVIKKKEMLFYESISRTKNISLIEFQKSSSKMEVEEEKKCEDTE